MSPYDPERHDPERHEAELIELLADDATTAEAAFEASALAGCDVCRDIAREHIELARALDGLGGDERGSLAAAESEAVAEGRAERALRELIVRETSGGGVTSDVSGASDPARRGPSRLAVGWLIAVAAVLVAVLVVRSPGPDDGDDPRLGPGDGSMLPAGEVADFSTFTWTHQRPESGYFIVTVHYEDASGEHDYPSPRIEDNRWSPPREIHEAWPDRIDWRLDVYSGATGGEVSDSSYSSARRSSD